MSRIKAVKRLRMMRALSSEELACRMISKFEQRRRELYGRTAITPQESKEQRRLKELSDMVLGFGC